MMTGFLFAFFMYVSLNFNSELFLGTISIYFVSLDMLNLRALSGVTRSYSSDSDSE